MWFGCQAAGKQEQVSGVNSTAEQVFDTPAAISSGTTESPAVCASSKAAQQVFTDQMLLHTVFTLYKNLPDLLQP